MLRRDSWAPAAEMLVIHLLIASAVVARGPRVPLARHRDVLTTQGMARGYFAPRPPHYVYLGLPYARPPTRARFKAPKPPSSWDGIFEATHRVRCLQPDGSGSEDCLVLNVFTPDHAKLFPVLVHIHDGGFQRGWGSHKPPVRLLRLGFVVVTFNYRLGVLGFLCLRTPGVPGNAGLKDQVAALYWVHRNIAYFGGNPQDVTIYGTGSGGVSAELLLLSEIASNLVHKAIIESGAVLSPSSISADPFALALADAITLGFKGRTAQELEIFYKGTSISNIINSSQVRVHLPCVENNVVSNSLLDTDPLEILRHGIYQHVPLLISYTKAQEVMIIADNIDKFNVAPLNFEQLLPSNLEFETGEIRHKMASLVKDFYFEQYELSESVVQNYIDYVNDIFMEYPIVKSSMLHAAKSSWPVYLMKFTYNTGFNTGPAIPSVEYGHVYNYIFSSEDLPDFDEVIAERLATLWSNFIRLGDPTPLMSSLTPVIWQPVLARDVEGKVDIGRVSYLQFNRRMTNVRPEGQQLVFWDYIYDKFYKPLQ